MFPKSSTDSIGLIHKNPTIVSSISSSSIETGTNKYVGNLINYSATSNWWCSNYESNNYFSLSFSQPVYLFNFSLLNIDYTKFGAGATYPTKVKVETFSQEKNVENHTFETGFTRTFFTKTFPTLSVGPIDSIKITSVGISLSNSNTFCLSKFDIFGFIHLKFPSNCHYRLSLEIYLFVIFPFCFDK